ncbi:hypothetical protein PEX2_034250 [Penicillium expansum]|uniref:Uncharacterized protein n=1 Tax=Penicillium expansum TaxID=27334 RepID=A0A0A2JXQ9_PENEN|nr:hypothetical protein PEX2_034250 [Penicillium expansum]KGO60247.1 hypothetical protein PEX2_034250 [Penicillium expansum]
MSFPESEKYSHSKRAKHFTMSPNASNNSLYLDSNVALEQRMQSESEVEVNNAALHHDDGCDRQEGVLAGIKQQFDSMAPGGSISEFGSSVTSAAQETVVAAKDTLMEGALPAAQGALQTMQYHIHNISGGAKEVEETVSEGIFFVSSGFPATQDLVVDEGVMFRDFPGGTRSHR